MKTFGHPPTDAPIRGDLRGALGRGSRLLLLAALGVARVSAAQSRHIEIAAPGTCPSGAQVAQELRNILPSVEATTIGNPGAPTEVVLEESASGVSVTFEHSRRYFADPAPQCSERASQVAVFIALMLDPLRLPPPSPEAASKREPPVTKSAPWEVEAGPLLAVSPGTMLTPTAISRGGSLRFRWGNLLSLTAGAGLLATTTLHYPQADAYELMIPVDAGARLTWAARDWDVGAELSLVFAPAHLHGQSVANAEAGWRFELGARGAAFARWWIGERVGLFVSECGIGWPRPITLSVGGVGEVGNTPAFWLGTQLGFVAKLN
jgi:hypothetical protein